MTSITQTDARQIIDRETLSQILPNLSGQQLDTVLRSINLDLTSPLRVDASATPDRAVSIGSSVVNNSTSGRQKSISHIQEVIPVFSSGTVTFPASNGGTITVSPGTNATLVCPSNQYIKALITIDSSGNLTVTQGIANAVEASALVPAAPTNSQAIAYISIFNNAGTIANIVQNKIFQIIGSGGSNAPFLNWSVVTGTTQNIVKGSGYISDNAAQVVYTLPETASVGDIFEITGIGLGGWAIESNALAVKQSITFGSDISVESSNNAITLVQSVGIYDSVMVICSDPANGLWNIINNVGSTISNPTNWFGTGADGAFSSSGGGGDTFASTLDGDMIVKNYTDFTVNVLHLISTSNRCKGLVIYCTGNALINGTIEMFGANADPTIAGGSDSHIVPASGLKVRRLKTGQTSSNSDTDLMWGCGNAAVNSELNQPALANNGQVWTIQRGGAAGGAGVVVPTPGYVAVGNNGSSGSSGQSGGGGGGGGSSASFIPPPGPISGAGASGTCFSGGPGGGGISGTTGDVGNSGGANGGAGGDGLTTIISGADGGSGNPAGAAGSFAGSAGANGTGGVIILIVKGNLTIGATGVIRVNGTGVVGSGFSGGGGSGGGNILILYAGSLSNLGTIQANGGAGSGTSPDRNGGNGGAGSIQGPTLIDA